MTHALDRLASNTIAQQQKSASPTSNSPTPPLFNSTQQQQQPQRNKKRLIAKTELRDSPLSSELLDLLLVVRMKIEPFTSDEFQMIIELACSLECLNYMTVFWYFRYANDKVILLNLLNLLILLS